ncbi:MFS transporter [Bradyrhizobium sp. Pear76]|uniref:MFS transporter n=1 Tax=Bradyrhizobium oropedii TaxID=1571201 RepID=UPI001E5D6267|nr:MFS transporter [Bradyrhizobium oropedii]MCC8967089.1 MFS transporter [Bradyrhizobium oropedii]
MSHRSHDAGVAGEWSRGWRTLVLATGGVASGVSLLTIAASNFVKPIEAATGWSRAEIALGTTLGQFAMALVMPLVGVLVDRYGIRRISVLGMIIYSALCLAMVAIPAHLATYYVTLIAILVVGGATSQIVFAPLVAKRFVRWRGTALGIVASGGAILLTPLAPVLVALNNEVSWRAGFALLAVVAAVVGLPCAVFASVVRPNSAVTGSKQDAPVTGLTLADAIRTAPYWMLLIATMLSMFPIGGFFGHMSALLSDKGMSVSQVGALASLFFVLILAGRTGVGLLLDVLNPPLVVCLVMMGAAAGSLLLLAANPSMLAYGIAVALIGCAMGAEADLQAFFVARLFGLRAFASIFGTLVMTSSVCLGLGGLVFGRLYDLSRSYDAALAPAAGAFVVAGMLFATLRRNPFAQTSSTGLAQASVEA